MPVISSIFLILRQNYAYNNLVEDCMQRTVVSIDNSLAVEDNFRYYLNSYKINYDERIYDDRVIFTLNSNSSYTIIAKVIEKILLIDIKLKYFKKKLGIENLEGNSLLLIAEMMFFDNRYEKSYLRHHLSRETEYSISGIFNFILSDIRNNWDYLIELYRAVDGNSYDMEELSRYIHDSAADDVKRIYLANSMNRIRMVDIAKGEILDTVSMPDSRELELFMNIISSHATHIYMNREYSFLARSNLAEKVMYIELL